MPPQAFPWTRDEISVTFDPFGLHGLSPMGGAEVARTILDAQLRLTQAVMAAAWTAQLGFLRATASAVQEAQGRILTGLMSGASR